MNAQIIKSTSKKGKDYEALDIKIGEYEVRLFPTRCEIAYLKQYFKEKAHDDFSEEF